MQNEVLVGLRINSPAKNYWFTPGGRIFKNEVANEEFNLDEKTEKELKKEFVTLYRKRDKDREINKTKKTKKSSKPNVNFETVYGV